MGCFLLNSPQFFVKSPASFSKPRFSYLAATTVCWGVEAIWLSSPRLCLEAHRPCSASLCVAFAALYKDLVLSILNFPMKHPDIVCRKQVSVYFSPAPINKLPVNSSILGVEYPEWIGPRGRLCNPFLVCSGPPGARPSSVYSRGCYCLHSCRLALAPQHS